MTDHAEEQEMEAEAMAAIFDTNFEVLEPTDNDHHRVWSITIYPETGTTDEQELESLNHVGCRLVVTLPETYPEIEPVIHIEIVKGLAAEHQDEIQQLALEEATNNIGTPSIYAITERVREWLIENNTKGLDDISMHAQMIRKKLQEEKSKVGYDRAFSNIHFRVLFVADRTSLPCTYHECRTCIILYIAFRCGNYVLYIFEKRANNTNRGVNFKIPFG